MTSTWCPQFKCRFLARNQISHQLQLIPSLSLTFGSLPYLSHSHPALVHIRHSSGYNSLVLPKEGGASALGPLNIGGCFRLNISRHVRLYVSFLSSSSLITVILAEPSQSIKISAKNLNSANRGAKGAHSQNLTKERNARATVSELCAKAPVHFKLSIKPNEHCLLAVFFLYHQL